MTTSTHTQRKRNYKADRRDWGRLRQLPSGNWRASYIGPDARTHTAPRTFAARIDAEGWLAKERRSIDAETWTPPADRQAAAVAAAVRPLTVAEWAHQHVAERKIADSTRRNYERALALYVDDSPLGAMALRDVKVDDVATWHARLGVDLAKKAKADGRENGDGSGQRAQTYKLLSSIFNGAVRRGLIDSSPARVEGGSTYDVLHEATIVTNAQAQALAEALPERLRTLTDVLIWSGLRIGEARALRRRDVDVADPKRASITVRRTVAKGKKGEGEVIRPKPKTRTGERNVAIPEGLAIALRAHMAKHTGTDADSLVFPSRTGSTLLPEATWRRAWIKAREAAGMPTVRTHDLRHTHLTLTARAGATIGELQARAGHASPTIAMRYQHAAEERDRELAARLDAVMRTDDLAPRRARRRRSPSA